ncbi:OST-HTH/LOTUS domain-containing protein [Lacimicrobium alkaliphilum]|uniref:HTH OST-type domain-containing protein n=1 Tax=Lacimicrobium alkaliphilum TaxID=1526571 RepID=A0ABQ1RRH8_9ALTE|nr:OST-HTH/LOTUS domain-containing protein [Lacimicrobium alkaliphilum]GGD79326.1 hypothetical protein GCM10011357_37900 [Lacimicrobium alkaliphilum]
MKDLDVQKKIAVLIDADNAQLAKLGSILDEISAHGHVLIKRAKPDFDPRSYGATKVTDLIAGLSGVFEMTKQKGKGTAQIILYRPRIAAG